MSGSLVCVVAALPAADVPDEEDFPPRWNSSQAFEAERHRFFPVARPPGTTRPDTICSLMRHGVRLHSVEVSMNVLNRRWLSQFGVGLLGPS